MSLARLSSSSRATGSYTIAHLNGGCYGDVQVLSAASIYELHCGAAEYVAGGVSPGRYGMGWCERDLGQTKTFAHADNVPDVSAFVALVPEQKRGVVMLFNAGPFGMPPVMEEVEMGFTALLAGQESPPIRLDAIQWIMLLLLLIPLLQIVRVIATFRSLRPWRRIPARRPGRGRLQGQQDVLPLIPDLSRAAVRECLQSSGLLRCMHLYMLDLSWVVRIGGGFVGLWAFLRSGLILQALREPMASNDQMEDAAL